MKAKTPKKRKLFKLAAPEAQSVFLAGSFNDWDPTVRPLKIDAKGVWKTSLSLLPGNYEYRYIVDGEWRDDPKCQTKKANDFGTQNCLLEV